VRRYRVLRHCSIYYRVLRKVSRMSPKKRPQPNLEPLGEVLRGFREAKDVSQEAFAIEHGFDRSVVGAVERGERNISFVSIRDFLVAHGVSWTVFGEEMQRRDPLPTPKLSRKRR
jgi:hypothetical protein